MLYDPNLRLLSPKYKQFSSKYDSRVINYARWGFIRLATVCEQVNGLLQRRLRLKKEFKTRGFGLDPISLIVEGLKQLLPFNRN